MQTGAVIVAAGACSRMGNFKPMMNVGSISISQRLVATLQPAADGVRDGSIRKQHRKSREQTFH